MQYQLTPALFMSRNNSTIIICDNPPHLFHLLKNLIIILNDKNDQLHAYELILMITAV